MRSVYLSHVGSWVRYLDLPGASPNDDTGDDTGDAAGSPDPVFVYVAGLGAATSADFPHVVAHPALRRHRSLLVDLVGTGWSDSADPARFGYTVEEHADAVAAVLDADGLEGTTVVGHSLGGSVAIVLAHRRPDLVGTLVACEPNLDPGVGDLSAHVAAQTEEAFVRRGYDALRAVVARDEHAAGKSVFHATTGRWTPVGMHRTSVSMLADREPTFRTQLTRGLMPRALLVGEHTAGFDLGGLEPAGVTVHVVPSAAHVMTYDNPAGFATTIAAAVQPAR
ncbi:Pimeloyl-ACP methyl ester carboxylesterase [Actinopolymorpha cephalotaxi]|uniref:Pimeloyl-ACP methyl ester carboxylesterase n=1 Tax=Actinopolymorpha cephalotaxi TaxID=504797 RepID=A0A1I2Q3J7_9ACTN|nr:alpha/beta hydrolase [Actinopolymorpha cephalotaxi]NYH83368.1 pimeloyl-ACP methyl ester carboxylesterase [Actinopolymorpha cephalotaxi]SFG22914.1 Pimeloyl-ACP methyl ester carboxylesterase [Actinopolymorpha cephalotaxi]